jgi:hypothetical protein
VSLQVLETHYHVVVEEPDELDESALPEDGAPRGRVSVDVTCGVKGVTMGGRGCDDGG